MNITEHLTLAERATEVETLAGKGRAEIAKGNLGAGYGYLKRAKEKLDALCEAL